MADRRGASWGIPNAWNTRLLVHSLIIGNISTNHYHLECDFLTSQPDKGALKLLQKRFRFRSRFMIVRGSPSFHHPPPPPPPPPALPHPPSVCSPLGAAQQAPQSGAVRWRLRKVARFRGEDQPVPATPELTKTPRRHPSAHVSPKCGVRDTCRPVLDRFVWRITMVGDQTRAD